MSRYHQLPRESIDSDRDDTDHQYLIPSPHSGSIENIYTSSPPRAKQGLTMNVKTFHRILSATCSLTGFLLMVLDGGYTFIPTSVFMLIALLYNIYMLFYGLLTRFLRFSIYYNGRDILNSAAGTFRKPSVVNFLDFAVAVGIFIPLTISLVQNRHWNSPVASATFGFIVITLQLLLAIPPMTGLSFEVRRVAAVDLGLKAKEKRSFSVGKADKKISMMVGAIDVDADADADAEETAIPAPLEAVEPSAEVDVRLV